ncbi:hypothetical protein Poli38472_001794 [Pythium oligandrum]|uniref:Uncharacterized protein n=1 Tax=Pythium oligandrum TaxID=41045 RepID=A0A8K1CWQ1_PYTOL|nr:hypothetical protein Poli38472_001794 [Pythium oligandrum]|eukprot:TMW69638.1 hypothetical protein Poli38472_001794 [Pythium oligandrum]
MVQETVPVEDPVHDGERSNRCVFPKVPLLYPYAGQYYYVRHCYDEYYRLVEELVLVSKKKLVTVTGTPGIGKSVFYASFYDRFREAHPTTWIIAASYGNQRMEMATIARGERADMYRFDLTTRVEDAMAKAELAGEDVLFLCDGSPLNAKGGYPTVVFTSPDERWLRSAAKYLGTVYMPLWTREELHEAAEVLNLPVEGETIDERFDTFGDVAHQCLSLTGEGPDLQLESIKKAIASILNPSDLYTLLMASNCDDTCLALIHDEPCGDGKWTVSHFASTYVANELMKRLQHSSPRGRATLRALIYEDPRFVPLRQWFLDLEARWTK